MRKLSKFYEISQNNTGGNYIKDDKLCNLIIIEAFDLNDSIKIAEKLGCYWNGVDEGIDCSCCGDRWYTPSNILEPSIKGLNMTMIAENSISINNWLKNYGHYSIVEFPKTKKVYNYYQGKINIRSIKEYAEFITDEYGGSSTNVFCRIFYKSGKVEEIYKLKPEERKKIKGVIKSLLIEKQ